MSDEFLGERRRVLENSFFAQRDRELMDKLREQVKKEALSAACGIKNPEALECLVKANIGPETSAALSIIPLVAVAWADGNIAPQEREAIRSAAHSKGIAADSVCCQLLDCWLEEKPQPILVQAWKEYIQAFAATASPEAIEALRGDVLGRAREVAAAAGGILGVHSISQTENAVLDDLASAFPS